MEQPEIENTIKNFIGKFIKTSKLENDTDFFASGLLNSLFAMQLVMFVEKEFAIKVGTNDLNIDNFKSINALTSFVESKVS